MNFCSNKQNPSNTIKKIERENDFYHVFYVDGSESRFYCSDKNKYNNLLEEMIEQAKDRDREENIYLLQKKIFLNQITSLLCMCGTIKAFQNNLLLISILIFSLGVFLIKENRDNKKKLKELKKYKIYLELIKNGKKEIPDISEFERYYRQDITINNIDEFDLSTLKYIKKYQNKIN